MKITTETQELKEAKELLKDLYQEAREIIDMNDEEYMKEHIDESDEIHFEEIVDNINDYFHELYMADKNDINDWITNLKYYLAKF